MSSSTVNIIPIDTTNPLVPRWRMDSSNPSETPAGYKDEFFQYSMNFTVAAGVLAQGLFIILDGDADFVLRQIEPQGYTAAAPTTAVGAHRIRDGFGNALCDDLLLNEVHGPLFPELWLPAGSRVFLDFDNTQQASSVTAAIILRGCKRKKTG